MKTKNFKFENGIVLNKPNRMMSLYKMLMYDSY